MSLALSLSCQPVVPGPREMLSEEIPGPGALGEATHTLAESLWEQPPPSAVDPAGDMQPFYQGRGAGAAEIDGGCH